MEDTTNDFTNMQLRCFNENYLIKTCAKSGYFYLFGLIKFT